MEDNSKLTGKPIDICALNLALYGKTDPDSVDISLEEMKKLWTAVMPTIRSSKPIGKLIITSTSESKNSDWFKRLWETKNPS